MTKFPRAGKPAGLKRPPRPTEDPAAFGKTFRGQIGVFTTAIIVVVVGAAAVSMFKTVAEAFTPDRFNDALGSKHFAFSHAETSTFSPTTNETATEGLLTGPDAVYRDAPASIRVARATDPIHLKTSKQYYVYAYLKHGSGDFLSIVWRNFIDGSENSEDLRHP